MIDKNGDTVDMFPIFSTLDEDEENPNRTPIADDNDNDNNAVGIAGNRTEKPSESLDNSDKVSANSTERAVESISERSENSAVPLVVSGLALVGIGVGGAILYKKRK